MNKGILAAIGAYTLWGLLPVYWKFIDMVPAIETLGHRMVWSLVVVLGLLAVRRRWDWIREVIREPRSFLIFLVSAGILALNWFTYIYAMNTGNIVEASLGYFINPLFSVVLGVLFLRERLRPWQIVAVMIAAVGVVYLTVQYGDFPWIALTLAITFGFYGLIRKTAALGSLTGLTLEMSLLFIPAMIFLLWLEGTGRGTFGHSSLQTTILLACTGLATTLPLLLFAYGAQRIKLATIGILQYIAPTLQFLLGVFVYREPFTQTRLIGFVFIWIALGVYTVERISHRQRKKSVDPLV